MSHTPEQDEVTTKMQEFFAGKFETQTAAVDIPLWLGERLHTLLHNFIDEYQITHPGATFEMLMRDFGVHCVYLGVIGQLNNWDFDFSLVEDESEKFDDLLDEPRIAKGIEIIIPHNSNN